MGDSSELGMFAGQNNILGYHTVGLDVKLFALLMFNLIDDLKQIERSCFSMKNNQVADKTGFSSLAVAVPDACFPSHGFWSGLSCILRGRNVLLEARRTRQPEPVW